MQATVLAFWANARYGVPNTEDERLSQAIYLMDSEVTLSQAAAICMVREGALRTRWNKRQADRRADEVGLLRNEWDSLLSAVRGRLLMIATDEGLRAGAGPCWPTERRLSTSEAVKLVSEVNGTKSGTRQARWSRTSKPSSTSIASGGWRVGSLRSVGPVVGVGRSRGWGWRWGQWERCRRT
jgi:hypothetical protein